jgi:hypothetical protein
MIKLKDLLIEQISLKKGDLYQHNNSKILFSVEKVYSRGTVDLKVVADGGPKWNVKVGQIQKSHVKLLAKYYTKCNLVPGRILTLEQVEKSGKVWIKKAIWQGKTNYLFQGNTFPIKDVFSKINERGKTFFWNSRNTAWVTTSKTSAEEAKKMMQEKFGGQWKDSLFTFKFSQTPNNKVPTSKELENLKSIWGEKNSQGYYSSDLSDIETYKAWDCPNCGTHINEKNLKSYISPHDPDREVQYFYTNCTNCKVKLVLYND